jgi:ribonuclease HI
MLEVYCDSSFNGNGPSFIGCVVLKDGIEVHQSTTRIIPDPLRNLECELAALAYGVSLAGMFPDRHTIIYNDSTEAVKEFQSRAPASYVVEYVSRDNPYQSLADRLSKKFPQALIKTHDLCRKPVETFTPAVLEDVGDGRNVLYLKKDERESTNTKTIYRLVIRSGTHVLSDENKYEARSGEVKNIKVARDVSRDLSDPNFIKRISGLKLEGAYFLLTDETWGLRQKGGEAYSIIPCSLPHHIICHEVDRSPENLFQRAEKRHEVF